MDQDRSTGNDKVTHKYTGQELDQESELYYYNARYYDPTIGRFLTPDTVVPDPFNLQSFNRYTYVLNNPIKYTDPTGHRPDETDGSNANDFDGGQDSDCDWNGSRSGRQRRDRDNSSRDTAIIVTAAVVITLGSLLLAYKGKGPLAQWAKNLGKSALEKLLVRFKAQGAIKKALQHKPSEKTIKSFERQLAKDGRQTLEDSRKTLRELVAKHIKKIKEAREAGGYTSSMERELRTFSSQIKAIDKVLK